MAQGIQKQMEELKVEEGQVKGVKEALALNIEEYCQKVRDATNKLKPATQHTIENLKEAFQFSKLL